MRDGREGVMRLGEERGPVDEVPRFESAEGGDGRDAELRTAVDAGAIALNDGSQVVREVRCERGILDDSYFRDSGHDVLLSVFGGIMREL